MDAVWKFLAKAPLALVAFLVAAGLLFLARFDIGLNPTDLHRAPNLDVSLAIGAVAFFLLGTGLKLGPHIEGLLPWRFPRATVGKTSDGFVVQAGEGEIRVMFGKLEELVDVTKPALVVLPANEYFDDECVRDQRSVLGSFVQKHFARLEPQFLQTIKAKLPSKSDRYEKLEGQVGESFGVGTCVFLDSPLGTMWKLLVVAVTSQRAGVGLRADVATLFRIIDEVHKTMADRRIDDVYVPLLGAGHGGLKKRAALFCLSLGFADLMCHRGAHEIRHVNIVVYRADKSSEPIVAERTAKRILAAALGMYADS